MNPEFPHLSPEGLEAQITALLLGELSADDAAAVEAAVAQQPELARLRDRLLHTIGLVREASAMPVQAPGPTAERQTLSPERREQLLEKLKLPTPAQLGVPAISAPPRRRRWMPVVTRLAVFGAMLCLVVGLLVPTLFRAKSKGLGHSSFSLGDLFSVMNRMDDSTDAADAPASAPSLGLRAQPRYQVGGQVATTPAQAPSAPGGAPVQSANVVGYVNRELSKADGTSKLQPAASAGALYLPKSGEADGDWGIRSAGEGEIAQRITASGNQRQSGLAWQMFGSEDAGRLADTKAAGIAPQPPVANPTPTVALDFDSSGFFDSGGVNWGNQAGSGSARGNVARGRWSSGTVSEGRKAAEVEARSVVNAPVEVALPKAGAEVAFAVTAPAAATPAVTPPPSPMAGGMGGAGYGGGGQRGGSSGGRASFGGYAAGQSTAGAAKVDGLARGDGTEEHFGRQAGSFFAKADVAGKAEVGSWGDSSAGVSDPSAIGVKTRRLDEAASEPGVAGGLSAGRTAGRGFQAQNSDESLSLGEGWTKGTRGENRSSALADRAPARPAASPAAKPEPAPARAAGPSDGLRELEFSAAFAPDGRSLKAGAVELEPLEAKLPMPTLKGTPEDLPSGPGIEPLGQNSWYEQAQAAKAVAGRAGLSTAAPTAGKDLLVAGERLAQVKNQPAPSAPIKGVAVLGSGTVALSDALAENESLQRGTVRAPAAAPAATTPEMPPEQRARFMRRYGLVPSSEPAKAKASEAQARVELDGADRQKALAEKPASPALNDPAGVLAGVTVKPVDSYPSFVPAQPPASAEAPPAVGMDAPVLGDVPKLGRLFRSEAKPGASAAPTVATPTTEGGVEAKRFYRLTGPAGGAAPATESRARAETAPSDNFFGYYADLNGRAEAKPATDFDDFLTPSAASPAATARDGLALWDTDAGVTAGRPVEAGDTATKYGRIAGGYQNRVLAHSAPADVNQLLVTTNYLATVAANDAAPLGYRWSLGETAAKPDQATANFEVAATDPAVERYQSANLGLVEDAAKGQGKEQASRERVEELAKKLDTVANGVEIAAPAVTPKEEPATAGLAKIEQETKLAEPEPPPPPKPAPNAPIPQPEVQTAENAFSTFSLNVSDVSFKLAAASLEKGAMPDTASIRSEEFINAFDYRDPEPTGGAPIAFAWERTRYPFAHNRDLLRFSVKTAAAGRQAGRPMNIVLLLDNSGSMERADRVNIIREALHVLAATLTPQDKLSVVTFSRTARLWVDGVSGAEAAVVADKVSQLTPQGGTNLEEAMNTGYQTALRHYLAGGINRVVLLTDGAANLGNLKAEALKAKVEAHRKQGIALDCFGIGWEGYNDDLLEVLSRNGDGRYGFVNTPEEAATELAGQLAGALKVAASDVKVQVEFNPQRVTAYRQIGYAKHQLKKEQFRDNTVDAAEIGAAEAGNALYAVETNPRGDGPVATVRVRFKVPGTEDYREQEWVVPYLGAAPPLEITSPAMRLATSASAFSEWLAGSPFAGEVTPDRVLACLAGVPDAYGADERPKKLEWMVRQAKSVAGK